MNKRKNYLDNIRWITLCVVILYHVFYIFNSSGVISNIGVKGIKNLENIEKDTLTALQMMCDEGKTSMLQDIMSGRKTEVEIFAGEIIRLGKMYGIPTPYNQVLYDLIMIEEEHLGIV